LAAVAGIDLQHVRRDDVLPAMVFEIVAHGVAPVAQAPPAWSAVNADPIEPSGAGGRWTFCSTRPQNTPSGVWRRHTKPGRISARTLPRRHPLRAAITAAHPFVAGSVSAMSQSR